MELGVRKSNAGALVSISALLFIAFFISFYSPTLEDAYITARYALRLLEGYPYGTWNRDSTNLVEGSTTTLWPFLMVVGGSKERLLDAAKCIAAITFLLTLFFFWRAPVDGPHSSLVISKQSPLLALVACGVYAPFGWYAASGMETVFYSSLVALVAFLPLTRYASHFLHAVLCFLLCLTRPDGILIAVSVSGFYAYVDRSRRWVFGAVLIFSASIFVARYSYFGYWAPNTVYAKSGDGFLFLQDGIAYATQFLIIHFILLYSITLAIFNYRKLSKLHIAILTGISAFFALIIKTGGDNSFALPFWRHFLQLLPLMSFLGFEGIAAHGYRTRALNNILIVGVFLTPLISIASGWGGSERLRKDLFASATTSFAEWIAFIDRISDDRTLIASGLGGELPFRVDAVHIDTLGLNNVHIAHFGTFDPAGPTDSKTDMAYVFSRRPDILDGYVRASAFSAGDYGSLTKGWRRQMVRDTLCIPAFRDYVLVANAPYHSTDRAIFLHRSFVERSDKLGGYILRPVRDDEFLTKSLDRFCGVSATSATPPEAATPQTSAPARR